MEQDRYLSHLKLDLEHDIKNYIDKLVKNHEKNHPLALVDDISISMRRDDNLRLNCISVDLSIYIR